MSGLDIIDKGEYYFNGININSLNNNELTNLRKDNFGLILQSYNLRGHLNVVQNVKLGAKINKSINDKYVEEIIITHNPIIANIADRIIYMKDGRIEKTKENIRKDIFNIEWSI